ncbi:MAG: hypothetical protein LBK97_05195 [Prevotellaceae bacterium]|jgi:predicted HicB family RNase H-like nuclease|nr:hypothetical protein [Prevotellaceae bacterium]
MFYAKINKFLGEEYTIGSLYIATESENEYFKGKVVNSSGYEKRLVEILTEAQKRGKESVIRIIIPKYFIN